MRRFTRISRAFWNNASVVAVALAFATTPGCMNRAPSLRMLDTRAEYGAAPDDAEVALYQRGRHAQDSILRRASPRVAKVYIFAHELPTHDYFWGGYVSLLVNDDRWVYQAGEAEEEATAGIREANSKSHHKRVKHSAAPKAPGDTP